MKLCIFFIGFDYHYEMNQKQRRAISKGQYMTKYFTTH